MSRIPNDPYREPPAPGKLPQRRAKAIALQKTIERRLQRVVETVPGTAHVRVTITRFSGGRTPKVAYRLSLVGRNDRVTLDTSVRPPRLRVWKGGPIDFRFTIAAAGTARQLYYPFGIAVVRAGKAAARSARPGIVVHETFPPGSVHIYGTSLYLTDNYDRPSAGETYEYTLLVQDARTGEVGVIDPGITHIPPVVPGM
jgi:hypothetical protein